MFCEYCGNYLKEGDRFCENCGKEIRQVVVQTPKPIQSPHNNTVEISRANALSVYYQFLSKMDSAATAWLVVGIFQLVLGVCTLIFCYGAVVIFCGIWNIVQSNKTKNSVKYLRSTSSGAVAYVDANSSGVLALILNIFFGFLVGIIPAAMDMNARTYGKNNRRAIWLVEHNQWI